MIVTLVILVADMISDSIDVPGYMYIILVTVAFIWNIIQSLAVTRR